MRLPRNLTGRTFAVVAASIALYALLGMLTGWQDFLAELKAFPLITFLPLVLLSLVNYLLRFWRWELFLRTLGINLPARNSLIIFFATFVMVVTPGKLGEAFKAALLREKHQVPLATGLPVVLAERFFDFLALLILACLGLLFWTGPAAGTTAGILAIALLPLSLLVLRSRGVRQRLLSRAGKTPFLQRYQLGLEEALASLGRLLETRLTMVATLQSTAAWAAECGSLWLVCRALAAPIQLLESGFIYCAGTLVGSLTFLPGGLGGTELTIIGLLKSQGIDADAAVTIALIVRLVTLWLAVGIGVVVLAAAGRKFLGRENS